MQYADIDLDLGELANVIKKTALRLPHRELVGRVASSA